VLSVAGRNKLRCLNHAQVIIFAGFWHHSDNRGLDRDGAAYPFHSLKVRRSRMRKFRNSCAAAGCDSRMINGVASR
jgi:hypothetical protein